MRPQLVLVLAVGLLLAADEPSKSDARKEMKQLEGTWQVTSASVNGKELPPEKRGEFVFAGQQITMKVKEGKAEKVKYRLDPSKKPKTINFTPEKPKPNSAPGNGIYEIEGDTLRICLSPPDRLPTEFSDKNNQLLLTLKRKK